MKSDWKKQVRTAGEQVANKSTHNPAKEPKDISRAALITVNGTAGLRGWAGRTPLQPEYFGTALEEREAHWPKGQVMAKLLCHTTVSPVDVCDVELSGSY